MSKTQTADLHDGMPQVLGLDTLAKGAVIELGSEALKRVAENMMDLNTDATQKREIVLRIMFAPYPDRVGAAIRVKVDTKLAGMVPAEGTMFVAKRGGEWLAYGRDSRQTEMNYEVPPDGKSAASKPQ